nr:MULTISPECIES: hypothetical protein [Acinetobacter]
MELNASTDKTAISSFALSVIVALILGGFATWLAYWYGRKSFQLTEMSFITVVEQIRTAEQSAFDLNSRLFNQQLKLQNNELIFNKQENKRKMIVEKSENFIVARHNILLSYWEFIENCNVNDQYDAIAKELYGRMEVHNFNSDLKTTLAKSHILLFNLNSDDLLTKRIKILAEIFMRLGWCCYHQILSFVDSNNICVSSNGLQEAISNLEQHKFFTDKEFPSLRNAVRKEYVQRADYYRVMLDISLGIDKDLKKIISKL